MGLIILQHKKHIIDWMLLHTLTANGFKTERIHTNWRHNWRGTQRQRQMFWPAESYSISILNIVGLMILHYSTLTIHAKTKEGFNSKDGRRSFSILLILPSSYCITKQNKTKQDEGPHSNLYNGFTFYLNWVIIESSTLYNIIIRVNIVYLKDLKELLLIMFNMLWWKL